MSCSNDLDVDINAASQLYLINITNLFVCRVLGRLVNLMFVTSQDHVVNGVYHALDLHSAGEIVSPSCYSPLVTRMKTGSDSFHLGHRCLPHLFKNDMLFGHMLETYRHARETFGWRLC